MLFCSCKAISCSFILNTILFFNLIQGFYLYLIHVRYPLSAKQWTPEDDKRLLDWNIMLITWHDNQIFHLKLDLKFKHHTTSVLWDSDRKDIDINKLWLSAPDFCAGVHLEWTRNCFTGTKWHIQHISTRAPEDVQSILDMNIVSIITHAKFKDKNNNSKKAQRNYQKNSKQNYLLQ